MAITKMVVDIYDEHGKPHGSAEVLFEDSTKLYYKGWREKTEMGVETGNIVIQFYKPINIEDTIPYGA